MDKNFPNMLYIAFPVYWLLFILDDCNNPAVDYGVNPALDWILHLSLAVLIKFWFVDKLEVINIHVVHWAMLFICVI